MKQHLLIVEDDEMVQALLAAYLQREGFSVSLATSGKEMLACVDSEKIDMILLDLGLPDEDGLTLARQVRARSTTPIIVLTVRRDKSDRLAALQVGADDYMTKPFDPEELILRIRNLLERAKSGTASAAEEYRSEVFRFNGWCMDISAHTVTDRSVFRPGSLYARRVQSPRGHGQGSQPRVEPGLPARRDQPGRRFTDRPPDRCFDQPHSQENRNQPAPA